MLYLYPTMQHSVMSFEFFFKFLIKTLKHKIFLDFFLEHEVLWLLTMLFLLWMKYIMFCSFKQLYTWNLIFFNEIFLKSILKLVSA